MSGYTNIAGLSLLLNVRGAPKKRNANGTKHFFDRLRWSLDLCVDAPYKMALCCVLHW